MVALIAGCAGPSAGAFGSGPIVPASELAGTWRGSFSWMDGNYCADEGVVLLEIQEDGTFTAAMTPTGAARDAAGEAEIQVMKAASARPSLDRL